MPLSFVDTVAGQCIFFVAVYHHYLFYYHRMLLQLSYCRNAVLVLQCCRMIVAKLGLLLFVLHCRLMLNAFQSGTAVL